MGSDPGKKLINIVEPLASDGVAGFKNEDDDSWSRHNGSIYVEGGDYRDNDEAGDYFKEVINFHPDGDGSIDMIDKKISRFNDEGIVVGIKENTHRIIK